MSTHTTSQERAMIKKWDAVSLSKDLKTKQMIERLAKMLAPTMPNKRCDLYLAVHVAIEEAIQKRTGQ